MPETPQEIAERLVKLTESFVSDELSDLRRRFDEVLYYMKHITEPNLQTLSHIRNILTEDNGTAYTVPENERELSKPSDFVLVTEAAAKPFCVTAQATRGKLKNRICLVSGHDTMEEAQWAADRLYELFGISAEPGRQ